MNFRTGPRDEPEINLIPFIDVLLVVLIFLMLSTTYSKYTELQLQLPVADSQSQRERPSEIVIGVSADGAYTVNKSPLLDRNTQALVLALKEAAAGAGKEPVLVISADASARHQAVITVLEAARRAGLERITFAAQSSASKLAN